MSRNRIAIVLLLLLVAALLVLNDTDVFQVSDVLDVRMLHHEHLVLASIFAAIFVAFSGRWDDAA
jgi:hypothetical protein